MAKNSRTAGKGGPMAKAMLSGVNKQAGRTAKRGKASKGQRKEGKGTGARVGKIQRGGNLAGY